MATPDQSYPPGDVRRYGAVGNWQGNQGADDTTALENALKCSASIFLPAGRFKTLRTLKIPAGVQIVGSGGDVCSIEPQGCDGLSFAVSHGIGPTTLRDFAVRGGSSGSLVGIKCEGTANAADQVNGIRIESLRIHFFQTAIALRTFWHSTIRGCVFNHVREGIRLMGQSVKVTIEDCQMVCDLGQGTGPATGITVDSTSDYNPAGKTRLRPESIFLRNNLVFGFDVGISVLNVLDLHVLHNVLDYCNVTGIRLAVCDGTCSVQDNWISLNSRNRVTGIDLTRVEIGASSIRSIQHNYIVATDALADSRGISVGARQNHCAIEGNALSGFTGADIYVDGAANTLIARNRCGSAAATYSIYAAAPTHMNLDGNFITAPVLLRPGVDGGAFRVTMPREAAHPGIAAGVPAVPGASRDFRTAAPSAPGTESA